MITLFFSSFSFVAMYEPEYTVQLMIGISYHRIEKSVQ